LHDALVIVCDAPDPILMLRQKTHDLELSNMAGLEANIFKYDSLSDCEFMVHLSGSFASSCARDGYIAGEMRRPASTSVVKICICTLQSGSG
jgi:hypothetical protein